VSASDRGEGTTEAWLKDRLAEGILESSGQFVFDDDGRPRRMSAYAFGRLRRKLKIFRWLDRLDFTSFLDVASGWEHVPYLVQQRYGVPAYYSDVVHELTLPSDGLVYGKLDHAVTLRLPVLPFRDDTFDVVLCSEVLEHLVRPVESIAELMRVSRRYVVLTSLEALSPTRWRRFLSHHRVDVRQPHVERNYFLREEIEAIFGPTAHHESLQFSPDAPGSDLGPVDERERAYAALTERADLEAALVHSVARPAHAPGSLGILVVHARPGATIRPAAPGADRALAAWLIDAAVREERFAHEMLAVCAAFQRHVELRPTEPRADRVIAADLCRLLRCPNCRAPLAPLESGVRCTGCDTRFPGSWGVPILYPTRGQGAEPNLEECLAQLCGTDAARRRTVAQVMRRLRRNERAPGALRRALWRLEGAGG
jgi:SAM-dependent methyltransferase